MLQWQDAFVKFYVKSHVEHLHQWDTHGNSYCFLSFCDIHSFYYYYYLKEKHTGIMENITEFPLSLRKKWDI